MDPTAVAGLAARVVAVLVDPIEIPGGARVYLTSSVGYAVAPRDGDENDDLARRVGLAIAKAKDLGGDTAVAFAPEMDLELSRRRALESALRMAVADDAIGVAYQPIMDPTGRRVVAVEALARWTDPLLGTISPEVFVPLAEETGLIPRIGERVLRRAVADGLAWPDIYVSVNVSAAQIHHGDVVAVVRDVLSASRFPPERLEIEITESVLLVDEKRANEQIKALQSLGVKVALDDFGSGYSSLLYLRKFGFDKLKIDRSFIEEIGQSADSSVILASIIQLGLDLKMTITAEGIETPEQHRWLRASGCHQLQGYLFSRPLTAEQLALYLAAHRIAAAG
jgi:predicted signal transduction protein with EAL and GGDEF domain